MELIDKSALVAEIENIRKHYIERDDFDNGWNFALDKVLSFIDTLEVKDPYEQRIQFASVKDGIEYFADIYSFNIESQLFPQLTKEQQTLWRKEIEQACISGGEAGVELARDPRYKENLEVKEVDLDFMLHEYWNLSPKITIDCLESVTMTKDEMIEFAKHFFELGLKAQKGE